MSYLFTSESVTEGHPDKLADAVSDQILDDFLDRDPRSRVAVETLVTQGLVVVAGEVTSEAYVDIEHAVRSAIIAAGYDSPKFGFDGNTCGVLSTIQAQSSDIARAVDDALESREGTITGQTDGAGDQGMMFGYACTDTENLMPLPITLAHALTRQLAKVREDGLEWIGPDGKAQVTCEYKDGLPYARTIVVSTQHTEDMNLPGIERDVHRYVIQPVLDILDVETSDELRTLINPSGRFVTGGPMADSGLTGRKIIVDTYGGMARHGGGAFSGKDPSKVDRSAAYAMRWVAKNIVAAGLADKCETQVSYAIGKADPTSFDIECFGTNRVPVDDIKQAVLRVFGLRPRQIRKALALAAPIYSETTNYGHFGRPDFTWERTNLASDLTEAVRG